MEFARVNFLQTLRKAAFIVAFFSSFLVQSEDIWTDGTIDLQPPFSQPTNFICAHNLSAFCSGVVYPNHDTEQEAIDEWVYTQKEQSFGRGYYNQVDKGWRYGVAPNTNACVGGDCETMGTREIWGYYPASANNPNRAWVVYVPIAFHQQDILACPPVSYPSYVANHVTGVPDLDSFLCYDPAQYQAYLNSEVENGQDNNYCNDLILDSGNNTSQSMCYTAYNGIACEVSKVTSGANSYYKGVNSNPFGCGSSENDIFDNAGIGNDNDSCINSNGTNFCAANKDSHCTVDEFSVESCDAGCIEMNGNFMCDASIHPDVGEGGSDYFDDSGTCSVVAGSSFKGICEEIGGVWSKEGDYTKTSCPASSITGGCSVVTNGGCFSCLDAGGTWTPDDTAPLTNTEKGIQDVAVLSQETIDSLRTLEVSTRKGTESLISTIKTGNQRLVGEVKTLTKSLTGSGSGTAKMTESLEELKEKETYTTTTGTPDKSKFASAFDSASVATLEAEITALKTSIQSEIASIRTQATALMTITVPTGTGYMARNLALTTGNIDLSLSRFQEFFQLLSGAIMLMCSILGGFIILGKD